MNPDRCIYCRACEVACEREHKGHSLTSVILIEARYPIPIRCFHCEKSPCVKVCPTNALVRVEEGAVIIELAKCIGCGFCAIVCPFGALEFDMASKVMMKCDLCIHRLREGREPACVTTCPTKALVYDEFNFIAQKVREKAAATLVRSTKMGGII